MPPPSVPTMITITHVINPIVDTFIAHGHPSGQMIPTFYHPEGAKCCCRAAPLIADLEAGHKVGGFLAHSATLFCPYCLIEKEDLSDLHCAHLPCHGAQVRTQAFQWLSLSTKIAREAHATETGVRWTPLHRLPYWDPVKHLLLGFMHNWLEGILQHQLRVLWGIGATEKVVEAQENAEKEDSAYEEFTDSDISESASELDDLAAEAAEYAAQEAAHHPTQPPASPTPSRNSSEPSDTSSNQTSTPHHNGNLFLDSDANPLDHFEDEDFIPNATNFHFTEEQLRQIQSCIASIIIPTWVQRPPTNLGEKSHGKLKAHEYLTLFTVMLPLVLAEIWLGDDPSEVDQQHSYCWCILLQPLILLHHSKRQIQMQIYILNTILNTRFTLKHYFRLCVKSQITIMQCIMVICSSTGDLWLQPVSFLVNKLMGTYKKLRQIAAYVCFFYYY